jgi:hypothetical protein
MGVEVDDRVEMEAVHVEIPRRPTVRRPGGASSTNSSSARGHVGSVVVTPTT